MPQIYVRFRNHIHRQLHSRCCGFIRQPNANRYKILLVTWEIFKTEYQVPEPVIPIIGDSYLVQDHSNFEARCQHPFHKFRISSTNLSEIHRLKMQSPVSTQ